MSTTQSMKFGHCLNEEIHRQTEALCRARPGFASAESWRARLAEKIRASLAPA